MRQRDSGQPGCRLLEESPPIQKPPADMRRGWQVMLVMRRHYWRHFGWCSVNVRN